MTARDESRTPPKSAVAEVGGRVKHAHKWRPNGTATDRRIHYSPVSARDHVEEIGTYAVMSCECGAVRRVLVSLKECPRRSGREH